MGGAPAPPTATAGGASDISTQKLYHSDAYLRTFTARVLAARPKDHHWAVELDRTAFYAEAGGQPSDRGRLGDQRVLDVQEDESTGAIIHTVEGPLAGEVSGEVDWPRRRDHMEQHTGQHLLSQAFIEALGAETVSFHLGEAVSTVDIALENLDAAQAAAVEDLANGIVREDREVRIHRVDAAGVTRLPLRKPPKVLENIRVVEIADFDWSACGGTHVRRTGELGVIKIKGWERYKKGVRVEFLAGGRAVAHFQAVDSITRDLCRSLTTGPGDLPEVVSRLRDEAVRLRKQVQQLQEQALVREAAGLLAEGRTLGSVRVVRTVFAARAPEEVKLLAAKVAQQGSAVAVFGLKGSLPQLFLARSPDVRGVDVGAILRLALPAIDGRGGGSPVAAQGAGSKPDGLPLAMDLCLVRLAEALSPA